MSPTTATDTGLVVFEKIPALLLAGGGMHKSLGPADHQGQTFMGSQGARGAECGVALGVGRGGKVVFCRALPAGIAVQQDRLLRDSFGQVNGGRRCLNREYPAVAGNIPVELIVVG